MSIKDDLIDPVNITEAYLYGINIRLNILIEMISSLIEVYANQNNIATENVKVEEKRVSKKKVVN